MKFFIGVLAALFAAAFAMPAQERDHYRDWGREAMGQVRADLDRADRDMRYLSPEEARRFQHVREALNEFARDWERGRFDGEALNETIRELRGVIERNRLQPRDRDFLVEDAARLDRIRERFDSFGRPPEPRGEFREGGRIRIIRAFYTADDGRRADVTRLVQDLARDGRLRLRVSNQDLGGDPAPTRPKMLVLVYESRGREQEIRAREGDVIELP